MVHRLVRTLVSVLVAAAGAAAIAGCAAERHGALAPDSVIVPSGGWPQPVDGRLTGQLCGLVVPADLVRLQWAWQRYAPTLDGNTLLCPVFDGGLFSLVLQPNAESAGLLAAAWRHTAEQDAKKPGSTVAVRSGDATGADEAFVIATGPVRSTDSGQMLTVTRRGALVVTVQVSDPTADPARSARLTGLILKRVPTLGRSDTGPTRTVRYDVEGTTTARTLIYRDPVSGEYVELSNVPLPWSITLPYLVVNRQQVLFGVSATPARRSLLSCRVTVDGSAVVEDLDYDPVHCDARIN